MTPADEKPNAKRLKADKIYLIALICMYFRPANTMNFPNICIWVAGHSGMQAMAYTLQNK